MTSLVAVVGEGKGTWGHVAKVIVGEEYENIILVGGQFYKDKFLLEKGHDFIVLDGNKTISEMVVQLKDEFRKRKLGTEVALNLVSGTGKEHMAVLSALLKSGVGIRLIALTKEGVKEI